MHPEGPESDGTWFALGLVLVGLVAALLAGLLYTSHPSPNTLDYELFKALITVVSVAVVGGFATFAFNSMQKDRDRRIDRQHRDLERAIDERRRRDELVSATLKETLEHWHAVKQIRREIEAITRKDSSSVPDEATIAIDDYDRYLRELSKHQLAFEHLKKSAPLLEEKLQSARSEEISLSKLFEEVEEFLNSVVDEYQLFRYVTFKKEQVDLRELAALSSKRKPKSSRPPRSLYELIFVTSIFRGEAGQNVGRVVQRLESALMEPIALNEVSRRGRNRA